MARLLLAERAPEQLGAALVRLYRSRLPAIEQVVDPGDAPERRDMRHPRSPTAHTRDAPSKRPHGGQPVWRARRGFASTSAARRTPIRNGCCRCSAGAATLRDRRLARSAFSITRRKSKSPSAVAAEFAANMARPSGDNIRAERSSPPSAQGRAQSPEGPKPTRNPKPKQKKIPKDVRE